jgi:hypothetical protein
MFDKVLSREKETGIIKIQARNELVKTQDRDLLTAILNYDREKLDEYVAEQKKTDPRYFTKSFPIGVIKAYRKKVHDFTQYPPPSFNMVAQYLGYLKDSENNVLGKLVHDTTISIDEFHDFRGTFEKHKFRLPLSLRNRLDGFINKDIINLIKDKKINFNTFSDESFVEKTIYRLKRDTRFSYNSGKIGPDETDLVKTIKTEFERSNNPNEMELNIDELSPFGFYTDVQSLKYALKYIIESMFDNSQGKTIYCKTDKKNYMIEIYDDNREPLNILPNREFLHGKLKKVIFHLTALCEYSVIVNIDDEGWKMINMMKDDVKDTEGQRGFTHKLNFKKPS